MWLVLTLDGLRLFRATGIASAEDAQMIQPDGALRTYCGRSKSSHWGSLSQHETAIIL